MKQWTHTDELDATLNQPGGVYLYCGFDPTADSLHVGSLIPIMALAHFLRHGHHPLALVGGATGMIGDPSGKSEERNLLNAEHIEHNLKGIHAQLQTILNRALSLHPEEVKREDKSAEVEMVNNADWMMPWSFIEFLRDVGKFFSINRMQAKESVKSRLETRDQGISYTEFSYMLIQAYDFFHLYEHKNCVLQIGGSDQWGNITEGMDLIRRKLDKPAFGLTLPLLMTADGKKFGKSEAGAVFLSASYTSPYKFYQYWLNQSDADMPSLLCMFTFLPESKINELLAIIERGENKNDVQAVLAFEVTCLVHGLDEAEKAIKASKLLFAENLRDLDDQMLQDVFEDVPSSTISRAALTEGVLTVDLFVSAGLQKSKSAARRLLKQGGVYLNNVCVKDEAKLVTLDDLASQSMLVLRSGKKKYHLVRVVD